MHTHAYTHTHTRTHAHAHAHRDARAGTSQRMAGACAAHHLLVDAITHRCRERHRARPLPNDHHTQLLLNQSARLRFQRRRRQLDRRCHRRHSRGRGRGWHVILRRPVLRRSGIGARRRGALVHSAIRCGGVRCRHRAGCARELRLQLLHLQSKRAQSRSARSARIGPACPAAVGARHDRKSARLHAHWSSRRASTAAATYSEVPMGSRGYRRIVRLMALVVPVSTPSTGPSARGGLVY